MTWSLTEIIHETKQRKEKIFPHSKKASPISVIVISFNRFEKFVNKKVLFAGS